MTQTTNRFFDEMARLMNDAAGVAQGVRREAETLMRSQAERFLRELDLVKREEFDAVKDMARLAREDNEALKARLADLDAVKDAARIAREETEALKARIAEIDALKEATRVAAREIEALKTRVDGHEAVEQTVRIAQEENEKLVARIVALEATRDAVQEAARDIRRATDALEARVGGLEAVKDRAHVESDALKSAIAGLASVNNIARDSIAALEARIAAVEVALPRGVTTGPAAPSAFDAPRAVMPAEAPPSPEVHVQPAADPVSPSVAGTGMPPAETGAGPWSVAGHVPAEPTPIAGTGESGTPPGT
jgi:BMFP domain-containing protein YqiC